MPTREDLRAIARQAQRVQFQDSTQEPQALTSAKLDSIDPSTGLDIVQLPDGGTATGQRIFSAGYPTGTFVRATQAPGGQVTLDWRNAPDIPDLVEDEEKKRSFKKKKEVDPADVPVLFITKETKQEAVSCRCTTYKRNAEGKYQEVCDGSGIKPLPENRGWVKIPGDMFYSSTNSSPPGSIYSPSMTDSTIRAIPIPEIDIGLIPFGWAGLPFVASGGIQNTSVIADPSLILGLARDLLKQGSSVIFSASPVPFAISPPYSLTFGWWANVPSSELNSSNGRYEIKYTSDSIYLALANRLISEVLTPLLGVEIGVSIARWARGEAKTLTVSKFTSPFSVPNSLQLESFTDLVLELGASNTPPVMLGQDGGYEGLIYKGFLGFNCPSKYVAIKDDSYAYTLFFEGRSLDPSYSGNIIIDSLGWKAKSTLSTLGAETVSNSEFAKYGGYQGTIEAMKSGQQAINVAASPKYYYNWANLAAISANVPYWLPPRHKNTLPPSKDTIAFWLGGCYKTPIKITELTADDPYAAYLSNTPEKIYVTIKASKEFGYKDLEVKKRPWCSITTWEVNKETQVVTEQKFQNPEVVTTNQGDWQKEWAHSYDPIPPIAVKPAKFDLITNNSGVSTAPQTFSLAPFVEAADPALVPKLVSVSITSFTSGGAGSVSSWNADNLTFVFQGSVTSLYTAKLSYTVDDGASQATSTIDLYADMIAPDMVFSFSSGLASWQLPNPLTISFASGDGRGNVPQVSPGDTISFLGVRLISVGSESANVPTNQGNLFVPTRTGAAVNLNPLGLLESGNGSVAVWRTFMVSVSIGSSGSYGVRLGYTISNGVNTREGNLYLALFLSSSGFR